MRWSWGGSWMMDRRLMEGRMCITQGYQTERVNRLAQLEERWPSS